MDIIVNVVWIWVPLSITIFIAIFIVQFSDKQKQENMHKIQRISINAQLVVGHLLLILLPVIAVIFWLDNKLYKKEVANLYWELRNQDYSEIPINSKTNILAYFFGKVKKGMSYDEADKIIKGYAHKEEKKNYEENTITYHFKFGIFRESRLILYLDSNSNVINLLTD